MTNPTFLLFNETSIPDNYYLERLRIWRDAQLKASDWTQLPDAVCDKAKWATYRQALRDLPAQGGLADEATFPVQPGGN